MKTVTLISKVDCHLCEIAKEVLLTVREKIAFELKERKISAADADFQNYHERIPVVLIDGKFAFQHKVSESQLMEKLRSSDC